MKLKMFRGLPAAGKSTLARQMVRETGNAGRVNRDCLRAMLFDSAWTGKREGIVIECEKAIAKVLIAHQHTPLIDDTNLGEKHKQMWQEFARSAGVAFGMVDLLVDAEACRLTDCARKDSVGRAVIDRMALQNGMVEWGDKPIVLCDIDGTLADGEHRVHHVKGEKKDWKTYFSLLHLDTPVERTVAEVRRLYADHTICLVSGRPDTYQHATMVWLAQHGVPYHWLFMRAGSDKRPDTMVKADFLKHMPKERIVQVFDDRPSVIRMWRENGLNVFAIRGEDCEEF